MRWSRGGISDCVPAARIERNRGVRSLFAFVKVSFLGNFENLARRRVSRDFGMRLVDTCFPSVTKLVTTLRRTMEGAPWSEGSVYAAGVSTFGVTPAGTLINLAGSAKLVSLLVSSVTDIFLFASFSLSVRLYADLSISLHPRSISVVVLIRMLPGNFARPVKLARDVSPNSKCIISATYAFMISTYF